MPASLGNPRISLPALSVNLHRSPYKHLCLPLFTIMIYHSADHPSTLIITITLPGVPIPLLPPHQTTGKLNTVCVRRSLKEKKKERKKKKFPPNPPFRLGWSDPFVISVLRTSLSNYELVLFIFYLSNSCSITVPTIR